MTAISWDNLPEPLDGQAKYWRDRALAAERSTARTKPTEPDNALAVPDARLADYHYIDLFRIIRGAGRTNVRKAQAAAQYVADQLAALTAPQADTLRADNERLRRALRPFAGLADLLSPEVSDDQVCFVSGLTTDAAFTARALRFARAALLTERQGGVE